MMRSTNTSWLSLRNSKLRDVEVRRSGSSPMEVACRRNDVTSVRLVAVGGVRETTWRVEGAIRRLDTVNNLIWCQPRILFSETDVLRK